MIISTSLFGGVAGNVGRLRKICWVYVFDPRQLQHTLFQVPLYASNAAAYLPLVENARLMSDPGCLMLRTPADAISSM